jgi:hypothetical protein
MPGKSDRPQENDEAVVDPGKRLSPHRAVKEGAHQRTGLSSDAAERKRMAIFIGITVFIKALGVPRRFWSPSVTPTMQTSGPPQLVELESGRNG